MKNFSRNQKHNLIKGLLSLFIILVTATCGNSQSVGISHTGSLPTNSSAGLDINFDTQGLLIPRVALTSTGSFLPLSAHVAGMVVYNTATVGDVTPGIYTNDGTKWVAGPPKGSLSGDMQYWNGTTWVNIPIGLPGQKLVINPSGVPTWGP
ncbi:MAG TPA: hypothetical protein PKI01_02795 [Bacteroidales bacterium]|nr:hypothetical protein [Bacteroidales bacterium]